MSCKEKNIRKLLAIEYAMMEIRLRQSQWVRLGNNRAGRAVVMDTLTTATISALKIVPASCLEDMATNTTQKENKEDEYGKLFHEDEGYWGDGHQ